MKKYLQIQERHSAPLLNTEMSEVALYSKEDEYEWLDFSKSNLQHEEEH